MDLQKSITRWSYSLFATNEEGMMSRTWSTFVTGNTPVVNPRTGDTISSNRDRVSRWYDDSFLMERSTRWNPQQP